VGVAAGKAVLVWRGASVGAAVGFATVQDDNVNNTRYMVIIRCFLDNKISPWTKGYSHFIGIL
jgi:hypothetical protein